MADEGDRAQAELEHLDGERRSLAAVSAAYDCILADAEMIRDAAPGATKVPLMNAFSNRLTAFQLLLAAFEPLAAVLSQTYGRRALQQQIEKLGAQVAWSSRAARIGADVERLCAEVAVAEETSAVLHVLERRLTELDAPAAALERDGHPGARERLTEVLSHVRAKIQALDDRALKEASAARWEMFTKLVPAAEDADVRRIQREIAADNRATTMKLFEIQRKAQEDAFKSMQAIHDKQNELNL